MFRQKTVVVVGAGGSKEVDLPIGIELANSMPSLLDFRFEHGRILKHGDGMIMDAFYHLARESSTDVNQYVRAAQHISRAMPQALSIDNFIDCHGENPLIALAGKLAIVRSILEAERGSKIYIDRRNASNRINFSAVRDTWFNKFVQLLTENCRIEQLQKRLSETTLIIFNYDRCFEHFLYHSLQNIYGVAPSDAASLINGMAIFHPYGTVGNLPWQSVGRDSVDFGSDEIDHLRLLSLADDIKTFTEGTDPQSSDVNSIREAMHVAPILVFLGFAFHRLNMELLSPGRDASRDAPVTVYATAKGMSTHDAETVKTELVDMLGGGTFVVRPDVTCGHLFNEYWRSLALS